MEAVGHAGTCLGMVTKDGIILAAERRSHNKLLDENIFSEKIYKINEDISCAVAGITSDANILLDQMRLNAQRHLILYQDQIPVEQLVTQICDLMHAYTMYGGRRPFGVSMLFIGWDKEFGYQLFQSDPSGNFVGWKATCIGSNSAAASSMLEQEYDMEKLDVESGLKLCVKILYKSMTMSKLTAEKVGGRYRYTDLLPRLSFQIELAVMQRKEDKTYVKLVAQSEIETLIKEVEQIDLKEKQENKS